VVRKFFALDKNYLLEEAQLSLQDTLLISLVEKSKAHYAWHNNPLQLEDDFSARIKNYKPSNLKPLAGFYETMAGIYRFRYGDNQLEFLWDGQNHFEKYQADWKSAFIQWTNQLLAIGQFEQAVLDLTVFLPENRHAQMAENRMNYVMLRFFSQQEGFPELKIQRKRGVLEISSPELRSA
jgi:hypothetical protein